MKRKTINLEKFLKYYTPFSKIDNWCREKHEKKNDLYNYLNGIECITINSKKHGLASLVEGNHSFTVFKVPRLQRGKLFPLRGKWVFMRVLETFWGGCFLEVFNLKCKPSAKLFEEMNFLHGYVGNEDYHIRIEEHYLELEEEKVYQREMKKPRVYILAFVSQYSPIKAICKECDLETTFSGFWSYSTEHRRHMVNEYQCQSCGELSYSKEEQTGIPVACVEPCNCGGQRRRDKNIFCPGCGYRKRLNNKRESFTTISQVELDILKTKHDTTLEDG